MARVARALVRVLRWLTWPPTTVGGTLRAQVFVLLVGSTLLAVVDPTVTTWGGVAIWAAVSAWLVLLWARFGTADDPVLRAGRSWMAVYTLLLVGAGTVATLGYGVD